ncbi:hypothetical protein HII31_11153 [Pseudocercospora fuligena]|uniref:Sexual development protein n=1 Tax=Pseudocercospora fuligena TaxID=685502 RepID=A0A8H6VGT4_9PEZI|nr:hypothetical protein HII31_11153 [Pseudocercospora fuligena]
MLSSLAVAGLLGLAAAAPQYGSGGYGGGHGGHGGSGSGSGAQQPFKFPLSNGFPNLSPDALKAVEQQAHGTLPNGPPKSSIQDATAATFQLIAFNELFEVAFFTSLINNITSGVYDVGHGAAKQIVLDALTAVQGQEELHATGANGILKAAGRTQIQPCEYIFPSSNFDDAIAFASTFTDVVLGTLQDGQNNFGKDGDIGFIPLLGSVIGQEGEQNGFYRNLGGKIPSQLPFLTRSAGPFAFSALNQMVIVPGSCPNSNVIPLPIFGALSVDTQNIQAKDQTLSFSFKANGTAPHNFSLVYINQQNLPVVEQPKNIKVSGGKVSFQADFPFSANLMNGLTISAVTKSAGPFADADAVAADTLSGPGLIEIN